MRIWFLSDLHLEFEAIEGPPAIPEADVCVVAGDVLTKGIVPSLKWLATNIATRVPVVFVAGNHEYYGGFLEDGLISANPYNGAGRLHFLENSVVEIYGTVFCGCTLWTDYDLFGPERSQASMREAMRAHNDYRRISYRKRPYRRLWPLDTVKAHKRSREFLEDCLERYAAQKLVFVTHHAPSMISVEERFKQDILTPAYASDLAELMGEGGPVLWVHGHIHHAADYSVGRTRVLCNPRGYPDEETYRIFDFGKVVDV